jgi:hypothetical protein
MRLCGGRAYDKYDVLFYADRLFETDRKLSDRINKRPRIEVLRSTLCIEGLFLEKSYPANYGMRLFVW